MKVQVYDIAIDPMEMPLCPICDSGIMATDALAIVNASGTIALAHEFCVTDQSPPIPRVTT